MIDLLEVARIVRGVRRHGIDVGELREVEHDVEVAVEVDADAGGIAARHRRIAVAPPAAALLLVVVRQAERAPVRVHVGEDDDVQGVEQGLDLRGGVGLPAVGQSQAAVIGFEQIGAEVDADVRASPLARMLAADDDRNLA